MKRGPARCSRFASTTNRLPRATAGSAGQRFQSSSHDGRTAPSAPATIASGFAASTASTLTLGAGSVSVANTFSPPHTAIACVIR